MPNHPMGKFFALHRNVRTRIALGFVNKLVDAMILTYIAIYLAARVGLATAGALILIFAVFAVFGMLAGGHLSERWGRRPVLIIGELTACVFLVLMAGAYYSGWGPYAVYLTYGIAKFGANLALPANDSTIVDMTRPGDRRYVYTVNYWMINLALGSGALLGGFLYATHFGGVIIGATIAMGIALVATVLFVSESKPEASPPSNTTSGFGQFVDGYRVVLADVTFRRLVIAATLSMTLEWQMSGYIGIRLAEELPVQSVFPLGEVDGVQMLGLLRAVNTVLVVVLALFVNTLLRRVSDRSRLYAGIALFTCGFAVLAVADSAWVLLLACLVLTIGELTNVPVKQSLLAELAPEQGRSRYLAAYYLNIRFGQVLNALFIAAAAILGAAGMAGLYLLTGVLIILQYRAILARREAPAGAQTSVAV